MRSLGEQWAPWLGILATLVAWQLSTLFVAGTPTLFPGPLQVLQSALRDVPLPDLLENIAISIARVVGGFLLGATLGIFVGIAAGWYRWLGGILRAPIELLRPIPPLAWIPLAVIWFGLGETSKLFVIFLGAFFPIVTNTYTGMRNIDPDLLRAGQILGLHGVRLLWRVAVPAALPDIATGIRIGWSLAFASLVAAEILGANQGLGYMIMHARELGQMGVIIYGIILISALSLLTDLILRETLIKRLLKWHFSAEPA